MQKSFHVKLIYSYHRNIASELRKMPKIYFCDLGFRNRYINNFSPIAIRTDKGPLLENYVFLTLMNQYSADNIKFWRTSNKQEVDFIVQNTNGKSLASEVKYSRANINKRKYNLFRITYPDIPLNYIDIESAVSL